MKQAPADSFMCKSKFILKPISFNNTTSVLPVQVLYYTIHKTDGKHYNILCATFFQKIGCVSKYMKGAHNCYLLITAAKIATVKNSRQR